MSDVRPERRRWSFFRAGGADQVLLASGADLAALAELDPTLWTALAMPVRGTEIDARTLELIDADRDGRVRHPDVLAAIAFARDALVDLDDLTKPGDALALDRIRDPALRAGARRVLEDLGKAGATAIALDDVADPQRVFAKTAFNGDGVVHAGSAEDEATRTLIGEIVATVGSVPDRSGEPGVDRARVEAFFDQAAAWVAWSERPEADAAILPLGPATEAAAAAVAAVRARVDDLFARCALAAFDPGLLPALQAGEGDRAALAARPLRADDPDVARLPLARVEPGRDLPLSAGVNPAWAPAIAALRAAAVAPLLGDREALAEGDWRSLLARLAPYEAWQADRPQVAVAGLGLPRLRELLAGGGRAAVEALLARDLALEAESAQVAALEKLLRLRRDLYRVLTNFASFAEFYGRKGAAFQAGSLYLDGRRCDLVLDVADAGRHASLAGHSGAFLVYCDCARLGQRRAVVAALTDGDADGVMVGRNGLFVDRAGHDWDATVTKVVPNPVSLREAFWAPYKRFVRLVEEQIVARLSAAEAASGEKIGAAAGSVARADATPTPAEPKKIDVGTVAAIGVAVGGIGALITGVLTAFFGLGWWMPVGLAGVIALISGPSVLLAWFKLRTRNLGPLLDANGWAVNGRARVTQAFGKVLTRLAVLPEGASRSLDDPYADRRTPWRRWVLLAVVVILPALWYLGELDGLLPIPARSVTILGPNAPAFVDAPPGGPMGMGVLPGPGPGGPAPTPAP